MGVMMDQSQVRRELRAEVYYREWEVARISG